MVPTEAVPMTTEELEALVRAIDADRLAGRLTREQAEEELEQLTGHR